MSQQINDNFYNSSPKPLDAKYLWRQGIIYVPYPSVASVNSSIPEYYRHQGLTVLINLSGTLKEYWYKNGTNNTDLVEKSVTSGPSIQRGSTSITGDGISATYKFPHSGSSTPQQVLLTQTGSDNLGGIQSLALFYRDKEETDDTDIALTIIDPVYIDNFDNTHTIELDWVAYF